MVDVYEVWSQRRRCRCIVKLLQADRVGDERARNRLLAEGRLLERLTHPHIVRLYETFEQPEPALLLEVVGGATVGRLIKRAGGGLAPRELAMLGIHLCSALHYLHAEGLLHLDLKPSNVISDHGRAKLIDLGLARAPGQLPRGIGTRRYMSPEQARGGPVGESADVWGLGAVLYEAATGRRAFARLDDGYEQLNRRAAPVASDGKAAELPQALANAIDSCLEPEPERRPAIEDLEQGLRSVL
jgi:eukaryotic-like serine/threonine-protein kinase